MSRYLRVPSRRTRESTATRSSSSSGRPAADMATNRPIIHQKRNKGVPCRAHCTQGEELLGSISHEEYEEDIAHVEAASGCQCLLPNRPCLQPEDYVRTIIIEGFNASTGHRYHLSACALFDTGNRVESMINLEIAHRLGLDTWVDKPSLWSCIVSRLFPCTHAEGNYVVPKAENLDGSEVRGRLHETEIRWAGDDKEVSDKCIFIRPQFITSKVRVMERLHVDVVFSLQEIRKQRLSKQILGGMIPEPPKPNMSTAVYCAHLADKSKLKQLKSDRVASCSSSRSQQGKDCIYSGRLFERNSLPLRFSCDAKSSAFCPTNE